MKFTFAHGWFKTTKTVEVIISVASSLHGVHSMPLRPYASGSALLMEVRRLERSEPVLFIMVSAWVASIP